MSSETQRNRQIAREFFEALSSFDLAKLDALYGEDFQLWTAGTLPFSGSSQRAQAMEGAKSIASVFPQGLQFTITGITAEGERVAIEAESDGIHASGRHYHNQYHFLMIVRAGKIRAFKEYMDTMHADEILVRSMAPAAGR